MWKVKLFGLLILTILIITTISHPLSTKAADIHNKDGKETVYTVKEDVKDDLYVAADEKVTVDGDVDGDLFVGGGTVDVNGNVTGNVFSGGGVITLKGDVNGSVFVAGGQLDIKGNVMRNVLAAGGTVDIDGNVKEDVFAAGGKVNLDGEVGDDVRVAGGLVDIKKAVKGDVMASGGTVNLDGNVDGDVHIAGSTVRVSSEVIGGDLVYYGDESALTVSSETVIAGKRVIEEMPGDITKTRAKVAPFVDGFDTFATAFGFTLHVIWNLLRAVGFILLGLLLFRVIPVKVDSILAKMSDLTDVAKSAGIGCLAIPVGIFVAFLLLVSLVGWPILGVLLALASITKVLTTPLVGTWLGRKILGLFGKGGGYTWPLVVGVFAIQIVKLVPCLGDLAGFLVFLVGIGAMVRMQYHKYKEAKAK